MPLKRSPARKPSTGTSDSGDDVTLRIDGHDVKCTRLSKVLYPEPRFTKAEVIDYYIRVAPFLLPHLKDRPVTLKRYPDGVTGQAYWDKDAPSFTPEWVETFPVPRHTGGPDINYVLIQNTATLAWTANVAALELHPFLHRVPHIQSPPCAALVKTAWYSLPGLNLSIEAFTSGPGGIDLFVYGLT